MSELPTCRWRREGTGPGRHACISPRLVVGPRGVPDEKCDTCFARDHAPPPRPAGPCAYLGPRTGMAQCAPCSARAGRTVQVPVHSCQVHGACTIAIAAGGMPCCATCPDRANDWRRGEAGDTRHLIYHLFPGGPVWRWNVAQLCQRLSLFNGIRRVSVAIGDGSASLAEVREEFGKARVELVEVNNHNAWREMTSFAGLMAALSPYAGREDVHLYAHGKGASSWGVYPGIPEWVQALYEANLDYWPQVRRYLRDFPCVGAYKRVWCGVPGSRAPWHYSGTFRWMRNADIFGRDWKRVEDTWCGAEAYPGIHFDRTEAACLHSEFGAGGLGLYLEETWRDWARASRETWVAESAADKFAPLLVTCILTSARQAVRVHRAIGSVRAQTSPEWELVVMDAGELSRAGAFTRYAGDARVRVFETGETAEQRAGIGIQGWAINEATRRGLVRGDLVVHLSDDDEFDPAWFGSLLAAARANPRQAAWYGWADRGELLPSGEVRPLGVLRRTHVGRPGAYLGMSVDGMQIAVRTWANRPWPELRGVAYCADAVWMDSVASAVYIHPLAARVGLHLHTPLSTFTRPGPV